MSSKLTAIVALAAVGCGSSRPIDDGVDARPGDAASEVVDSDALEDSGIAGDAAPDSPEPAKAWGRVLPDVTLMALGPAPTPDSVAVAGRAGLGSTVVPPRRLFATTTSSSGPGAETVSWEHDNATVEAVVWGAAPVVAVKAEKPVGFIPVACIEAVNGTYHFYPPKSCGWRHSVTPIKWLGLPELKVVLDASNAGLGLFFSSAMFHVDSSTTTGGNGVNLAMDGTLMRSTDDRAGVVGVCRDDKATLIAYVNAAAELRIRRLDASVSDIVVASSAGSPAALEGRVGLACDASGPVLAFRPVAGTSILGRSATAGDVVVVPLVGGKAGAPSWSHLPAPLGRESVRVVGGATKATFAVELAGGGDLDGVPVSAGPIPTLGATIVAEVTTTAKLRAVLPASIVGLRFITGHVVVAGPLDRPISIDGIELTPVGTSSAFVLGLRL